MTDQSKGMMAVYHGILFDENINMPKMNIVVGQGTPKVGIPG
jgi:hypothetical protein